MFGVVPDPEVKTEVFGVIPDPEVKDGKIKTFYYRRILLFFNEYY